MYEIIENMLKTAMCQQSNFSSLTASQLVCVCVCVWVCVCVCLCVCVCVPF